MSCEHERFRAGRFQLQRKISIFVRKKEDIPKYELFVRTQNIFSGSTIVSAWIGAMSTSHHSSIVAQYHHNRTKLYILAMILIAFTATAASTTTTLNDDVDNGFVSASAAASAADEYEFGSLFVRVGVDATFVVVVARVVVIVVVLVSSIKNN